MILKAVLPEDGQDDFTNDVKKCYINLKIWGYMVNCKK
jgi:hypothetical protein